MIGFIETGSSGGMVPLSAIKRIGEEWNNEHGVEMRTAELFDGNSFDLLEHNITDVRLRPAQIIPALPGVKFLHVIIADDRGKDEIWDEPVIAWALCLDGEVRPVTPSGVISGTSLWNDHYVEIPGGRIQAVGQHSAWSHFDDRDEMLRHFVSVERAKANAPGEFVSQLEPDPFGQKPAEQPELDRLIAVYVETGNALIAGCAQVGSLPDDDPLGQAYLAATSALDSYEAQSPEEFVRHLAARFDDGAFPTEDAFAMIIATATRLAKGEQ